MRKHMKVKFCWSFTVPFTSELQFHFIRIVFFVVSLDSLRKIPNGNYPNLTQFGMHCVFWDFKVTAANGRKLKRIGFSFKVEWPYHLPTNSRNACSDVLKLKISRKNESCSRKHRAEISPRYCSTLWQSLLYYEAYRITDSSHDLAGDCGEVCQLTLVKSKKIK